MSAGTRLPGTPDPARRIAGQQGLMLAADEWGPRDGIPVVLLHGGGQTRHAWRNTGEVLGEAGFHAVAVDARGHGDSEWSAAGDYGHDAMVADLRAVVDSMGGQPPVLVGASMGGQTSLVAAGTRAVPARAIVLVDVAPKLDEAGVGHIQAFMRAHPNGFANLDEVADTIAGYQPHRKRPTRLAGLAKNVRLHPDGRYRWHWDPRFLSRPRDLQVLQERLRACARTLRIPALLVRGAMSDVLSEEGVRDFLELVPHAEVLHIREAGHMVAGDRNDLFGRGVVEFLTRPGVLGAAALGDREALLGRLAAEGLEDEG